jgi:hypothetical protein
MLQAQRKVAIQATSTKQASAQSSHSQARPALVLAQGNIVDSAPATMSDFERYTQQLKERRSSARSVISAPTAAAPATVSAPATAPATTAAPVAAAPAFQPRTFDRKAYIAMQNAAAQNPRPIGRKFTAPVSAQTLNKTRVTASPELVFSEKNVTSGIKILDDIQRSFESYEKQKSGTPGPGTAYATVMSQAYAEVLANMKAPADDFGKKIRTATEQFEAAKAAADAASSSTVPAVQETAQRMLKSAKETLENVTLEQKQKLIAAYDKAYKAAYGRALGSLSTNTQDPQLNLVNSAMLEVLKSGASLSQAHAIFLTNAILQAKRETVQAQQETARAAAEVQAIRAQTAAAASKFQTNAATVAAEKDAQIAQLTMQLSKIKSASTSDASKLSEQLKERDAALKKFEEEKAQLENELKEARENLSKSTAGADQTVLRQQLAKQQEMIAKIAAALDAKNTDAAADINALRSLADDLQKDGNDDASVTPYVSMLRRASQKLEDLVSSKASTTGSVIEQERTLLQDEVNKLKEEAKAKEAATKEYESKIAALEAQVSTKEKDVEGKLKAAQDALKASQAEVQKLTLQMTAQNTSAEEAKNAEIKKLTEQISQLAKEKTDEVQKFTAQQALTKLANDQMVDLQTKLTEAAEKATRALQRAEKAEADLKAASSTASSSAAEVERKIEEAQKKWEESLLKQLSEAGADTKAATASALVAEFKQLKEARDQSEKAVKKAEEELKQAKSDLASANAKSGLLQGTVTTTKQQVETLTTQNTMFQNVINVFKKTFGVKVNEETMEVVQSSAVATKPRDNFARELATQLGNSAANLWATVPSASGETRLVLEKEGNKSGALAKLRRNLPKEFRDFENFSQMDEEAKKQYKEKVAAAVNDRKYRSNTSEANALEELNYVLGIDAVKGITTAVRIALFRLFEQEDSMEMLEEGNNLAKPLSANATALRNKALAVARSRFAVGLVANLKKDPLKGIIDITAIANREITSEALEKYKTERAAIMKMNSSTASSYENAHQALVNQFGGTMVAAQFSKRSALLATDVLDEFYSAKNKSFGQNVSNVLAL